MTQMLRTRQKAEAFFPLLAAFLFLTPSAAYATSYSLVTALHGISTNETVVEGQAGGSLVTRSDIGSQAITPNWTWDYSATSSAKVGELHGSSFIDISCTNEPYCSDTPINSQYAYHSVTQASYGDTATIFSPGHNGESGYASFYYHLDGSITLTQLGAQTWLYGQMTLCNGFCGATNVISSIFYTNSSTSDEVLLGTIPITYGTPFSFGTNLFTRAQATFTSGTLAAVYLSSDFSDTAIFNGLATYTSDGVLVTDAMVVSDSGYDYNATLIESAVPEPSVAGLVGIAMLCLLVLRTGRKSQMVAIRTCLVQARKPQPTLSATAKKTL